jgi:hypothetical protein
MGRPRTVSLMLVRQVEHQQPFASTAGKGFAAGLDKLAVLNNLLRGGPLVQNIMGYFNRGNRLL